MCLWRPRSRVGPEPFVVPGAGPLQWEQAEILNGALRWLCPDGRERLR